jgi:hypothetical protein
MVNSLYIYYQPWDVLSAVSCVEFYEVSTMDVFPKYFSLIGKLKILISDLQFYTQRVTF